MDKQEEQPWLEYCPDWVLDLRYILSEMEGKQ